MNARLGPPIGALREATVRRFNPSTGKVTVSLNEAKTYQNLGPIEVDVPAAWAGPKGQFIGGYPAVDSTVIITQGAGNKWYIVGHLNSQNTYDSPFASSDTTLMSELRNGRAMMQVENGHRIFLDPYSGAKIGGELDFLQANASKKILSHNFDYEMSFTQASRKVDGVVRRDILENSNRDVLGSTLESQEYDESLYTISMDPSTATSILTSGENLRNPPLTEQREITYEFANSFEFSTYQNEYSKYVDPEEDISTPRIDRRNIRADALSLSLEHPNHLIETIKGTAVDTFGNIIDLNRNILPIGQTDSFSLYKSEKKPEAFNRINSQLRKSIAFHWELNARKEEPEVGKFDSPMTKPDVGSSDIYEINNYARDRSRFYIDIDKEGQFKINVPASSETGNIPLLARHENFSVVYAKENENSHPNTFIREENNKEIFLDGFSSGEAITIKSSDEDLESFIAPTDRITDQPIKYGTAFHDITNVCSEFLTTAGHEEAGTPLVHFYEGHILNQDGVIDPYEKIISNEITAYGTDANAGGRSGSVTFDGFISVNVGANTIDRQSAWYDYAGAVVARVGRDKQGISYAASLDGDMLVQIGGVGLGNDLDTRFEDENDAYRAGALDIRVLHNNMMSILRIGRRSDNSAGIDIVSAGNLTITSRGDMIIKSNSALKFDAPEIVMHSESSKRIVQKFPPNSI